MSKLSAQRGSGHIWDRYDVVPVAKPRMTQRDKWARRPAVLRYRAYKDELRLAKVVLPPFAHVVFVLPMPKSWHENQKIICDGMSHTNKPDVDNLHKGLLDALYGEDCTVWDARITKIWGRTGCIYVGALAPPELP